MTRSFSDTAPVRVTAALISNCDIDFVPLNSTFNGLSVWERLSNVFAHPEVEP